MIQRGWTLKRKTHASVHAAEFIRTFWFVLASLAGYVPSILDFAAFTSVGSASIVIGLVIQRSTFSCVTSNRITAVRITTVRALHRRVRPQLADTSSPDMSGLLQVAQEELRLKGRRYLQRLVAGQGRPNIEPFRLQEFCCRGGEIQMIFNQEHPQRRLTRVRY